MLPKIKYSRISFLKILLGLLFIVLQNVTTAQINNTLKYDKNGKINVRTSEKIQKFLNDDFYLYDTEPSVSPESFWQRIWSWINKIIFEFFYLLNKGGNIVSFIFYGLILALLIFIILKLIGVSPHRIFLRTKKIKVPDIPVYDEDINALDFNKIISEAIEKEDYRKAVRFLYIKFLKILSDTEYIEWKPEKTNKDYNKEMRNTKLYKNFMNLTRIYDYVWYGEFKIKALFFNSVNKEFKSVFKEFE